jgi:ATP-dependent DNA helicase RecG
MDQTTGKLLRDGENERVAFVRSPDSRDAIGKAVCSLLNSTGGSVLVGATESGGVAKRIPKSVADEIREFLNENIAPHALFTVSVDRVRDGMVAVVDVPAGCDVPYVFQGAVYVRSGSRTLQADAEAMRDMVERRATETERWERRLSPALEVSDLSAELIRETVRNAANKRGFTFRDPNDSAAVLTDLGLMQYGQLTNGADVLFAETVAIRHPQTRLRAVLFETDKTGDYLDDLLFEGTAFDLLNRAMAFVRRSVSVGANFQPERLRREVRPQYMFNAVREGLVNALVHRDYAAHSGSVALYIYPGRIEIWNSGQLPEGIRARDLHQKSHRSVLVNPDISHVFYLHELMERVGRGTYMIVQECKQLGARSPQWRQDGGGVELTIFAAGPSAPINVLNDRQLALVSSLKEGDELTSASYVENLAKGITPRQARRDLSDLVDLDYLHRVGSGPATKYVRTNKSFESGHPDMSGRKRT